MKTKNMWENLNYRGFLNFEDQKIMLSSRNFEELALGYLYPHRHDTERMLYSRERGTINVGVFV